MAWRTRHTRCRRQTKANVRIGGAGVTTVEVTPRSPRPPIRLRRAPQYEPPFDDERDPEAWESAHQLALVWPARAEPEEPRPREDVARAQRRETAKSASGQPTRRSDQAPEPGQAGPAASPGLPTSAGTPGTTADAATATGPPVTTLRAVTGTSAPGTAPNAETAVGTSGAVGGAGPDTAGVGPPVGASPGVSAPAGASRDAKLAVRRFVSACVEVLNGYRPAAHLRRLALPAEAARVVAQSVAGAHRVAELRRGDPRRPAHRSRVRPAPVAVIHLWLCEPRPGAVEASVVLVTGDRTWALALRLELHHESWLATALRLI